MRSFARIGVIVALGASPVLVASSALGAYPQMRAEMTAPKTLVAGSPGTFRVSAGVAPGMTRDQFVWPTSTAMAWYEPMQDADWLTGGQFAVREAGAQRTIAPSAFAGFAGVGSVGMAHVASRPTAIPRGDTRSVAGSTPVPVPAFTSSAADDTWYIRASQVAQSRTSRRVGGQVKPLLGATTLVYDAGRWNTTSRTATGFSTGDAPAFTCAEVAENFRAVGLPSDEATLRGEPCIEDVNVRRKEWNSANGGASGSLAGAYFAHPLGGPVFAELTVRGGSVVRGVSAWDRSNGYGIYGLAPAAAGGVWKIAWCRSGPPLGAWKIYGAAPRARGFDGYFPYGDAGCRSAHSTWDWQSDRTGLSASACPARPVEDMDPYLNAPGRPGVGAWISRRPWMDLPPECTATGFATRGRFRVVPDQRPSDAYAPTVRWSPGEDAVCRAGWSIAQVKNHYLAQVKALYPNRALRAVTSSRNGRLYVGVSQQGTTGVRSVDAQGRRFASSGAEMSEFPAIQPCQRPGYLGPTSGRWVERPAEADFRTSPDAHHPGTVNSEGYLDGRLPIGHYLLAGYVAGDGEWSWRVRQWQPSGSRWEWTDTSVQSNRTETRIAGVQPTR